VVKLDDGHCEVMATKEMIKCFTIGKEEREKNRLKAIMIGAIFGLHSIHHRGCE
jgi:hypothetical protein